MNFKLIFLCIAIVMIISVLAGCSRGLSDRQKTPTSTTNGLPVLLPTYTLTQPADINPGRFIRTVYISDHDNTFHKSGCPNLTTNINPIPREGALIQGFTACQVCKP
jgi:hypothetical protein